ncbi:LANO_0H18844g1_1 [Lachancea nothofagi CBS 11611]|uniref:LANO_0H18844g1_1 n=1 Tax=Lachancea nothofagi CBS 11611 TaxID=1266666 RepID=A0A1G4KN22_9SACH|nr:LANO_0H18844g1_1 [Lachancea nothofagi CBS 11611]
MFFRSIACLITTFVLCTIGVTATGSTYSPVALTLPSFTKECLYFDLVSNDDSIVISYQVLTGGNFEIDFEITAPDESVIATEKQKKYSDFLLKSFGLGQYSFCFSNSYGTALKKVEVTLELEKENLGAHSAPEDAISSHSIEEIERNLNKITKMMNYLRAREWRNMYTVKSTESRLVWLSMLTMGLMVGVSVIQATIVQFLFKDRQKNYV